MPNTHSGRGRKARGAIARGEAPAPAGDAAPPGLPLAELPPVGASRPLRIAVLGAHPDDPESGCGGTIARYAAGGHAVVVFYLTRGEAGIRGTSHDAAAAIRTAEAERACAILGATPRFVGQIDGETEISVARYAQFEEMLSAEKPDVLLAHWPIDTHRDHRVASLLAYDAWLRAGRSLLLCYFEVMAGAQSQQFHPTHYVDITAFETRKRDACYAHASQGHAWYDGDHVQMHQFRGREAGVRSAEAFVVHARST